MLWAIYTEEDAGFDGDKKQVKMAGLKLGEKYEVRDIDMGNWHTDVYLKGFDEPFNSVFFDFEYKGHFVDIYEKNDYERYL